MLQRIISIKNVGRFRNCAAVGDVSLRRATLIHAENGRGKTTLCAILRSLSTNQPDLIVGRTSLGGGQAPEVQLLVNGQNIAFRNGAWSGAYSDIAVFDATYVSENVFAGDIVTTDHRRNLYRVIIGALGVTLANRINQLDTDVRTRNNDIRDLRLGLRHCHGERLSFEAFQALPVDDEIDPKIEAAERELRAAQQVAELLRRPEPRTITWPVFPPAFAEMLAKTLPDVSAMAEKMVTEHIARHRLGQEGERWLATGLEHAQSGCPFCGRSLDGSELIAAYRAFFSEAYHGLKSEVERMHRAIDGTLADRVAATIEQTIIQNANDVEYWKTYCTLEDPTMPYIGQIAEIFAQMRGTALTLLTSKLAGPLEAVAPDEAYTLAIERFESLRRTINTYNTQVAAAAAVIQERKRATQAADLRLIGERLNTLRAQRTRHTQEVAAECDREAVHQQEKGALETEKNRVRRELDTHTADVIALYGNSINRYLERINAGFRITAPVHSYRGGTPSTSYQIVINQTPVDLGDSDTPDSRPSFRNTLSSGDKSTLALAFFLAQLEQDPRRAQKTIVFDDPFTSMDAFRRSHTVQQVYKCVTDCTEVIVLSHDPMFLKALWDRVQPADRKTLQLVRVGEENTTIAEWDIDQAVAARYMADIDALMRFRSVNDGNARDVVQKIRPVLEGYCRNLFPMDFGNDNMGVIVGKIKTAGPNHQLASVADDFDELNIYCRRYHHGENPAAATEPIDDAELQGYVGRTLKLVGCLL